MSKYLLILILAGIIPFLLSFYKPLGFYKNIIALIKSIALITLIFGTWDILATFRGHWKFNPQMVGSIKIINLPLEEVLFFIVIPFCCIFTWEAMKYIKTKLK